MIGIIPAAGGATRFGGALKELLPIGPETCLLDNAIRQAERLYANEIVVVTRGHKLAAHAEHLRRTVPDANVSYIEQKDSRDMWGAIAATLYRKEESILVMPDTVFTAEGFFPNAAFCLGLFPTNEPWRYDVLKGLALHHKPHMIGQHNAWGTVYWNKEVSAYWYEAEQLRPYASFTVAFNEAMQVFGFETFDISNYYDLGSWQHYREYIREH